MSTANLDLGINTSSANSALDNLLAKIDQTKAALQGMLGAAPASPAENVRVYTKELDTLKAALLDTQKVQAQVDRERIDSTKKVEAETLRSNDKLVKDAEKTARSVKASYRVNLGDGITMMMKIDPKTAIEGATDIDAILKKSTVVAEAEALKRAKADEAAALKRVEAERKAAEKIEQIRLKEAEAQRRLNTGFLTASPRSQLNTLLEASAYRNLGGDPSARYGSEAAARANAAGIAQLTMEVEKNAAATRAARGATRQHARAMNEAHAAARGLAGGFGALWTTYGSILPLMAGFALAAGITEAVKGFTDVQYQMTFVKELTEDTTHSVEGLTAQMHQVSLTLGISPTEASKGLRILAQAGLDTQQALNALPTVFKAATVGEMEMGAAANSLVGVMNAFNLGAGSLEYIGDVMAKAGAMSATSIASMTESMKIASPVAAQFNITLEETSLALTALAKMNITGTAAGTSVKNMIQELAAPTSKKARDLYKELGFSAFDEATGKIKPLVQQVQELRKAIEQYTPESQGKILMALFGQKGEKAFFALLKQSEEESKKMLNSFKDAGGFTADVFSKLQLTAKGQFDLLKATITNTFSEIGSVSNGPLVHLMRELREIAGSEAFKNGLIGFAQSLVTLGTAAVTYGPPILLLWASFKASSLISVGLTALGPALAALRTSVIGVATATTLLSAAMKSIPLVSLLSFLATGIGLYLLFRTEKESTTQKTWDEVDAIKESTKQMAKENDLLATKINLMAQGRSEAEASTLAQNNLTQASLATRDAQLAALRSSPEYLKQQQAAAEYNRKMKDYQGPGRVAAEALGGGMGFSTLAEPSKPDTPLLDQVDRLSRENAMVKAAADQARVEAERRAALARAEKARRDEENAALQKKLEETFKSGNKVVNLDGGGKAAANDLYNAAQAKIDGDIQALQRLQKSITQSVQHDNKIGVIGDFEAIDLQLQNEIEKKAKILELYAKKEMLAVTAENHKAQQQKIVNRTAEVGDEILAAQQRAEEKKKEITQRIDNDLLAVEKRSMLDRGRIVDAFLADYEQKYGKLRDKLAADLMSPKTSDASKKMAADGLAKLGSLREDGVQRAQFEEKKNEYLRMYRDMQREIEEINANAATKHGGISGSVNGATDAQAALDRAQPALARLRMEMEKLAAGNPKLQAEVAKFGRDMASAANQQAQLWRNTGKAIETSLTEAFGKSGKALGGLISTVISYGAAQKEIDDRLKKKTEGKDPNDPKVIAEQGKARKESFELQMQSYGDLAGAAKGFFDEQSQGYQVLSSIEKAYRVAQLGMALYNLTQESGILAALFGIRASTTAASQTLDAAHTTTSVTNSGVRASADGSAAISKTLASVPYPYNLIAAGTVLAALLAVGVSVAGGGFGGAGSTPDWAAERQKTQGTGTVLGAPDQQSESIGKSLDDLKNNSDITTVYTNRMLTHLQAIRDGIAGLGKFVAQAAGISGNSLDQKGIEYSTRGFLGFSSETRKLLDSGIVSAPGMQNYRDMARGLYNASGYQDIQTHSSSWWGLSQDTSNDRRMIELANPFKRQLALVITSLGESISAAGESLGLTRDHMQNALGGLQITLGDISLKGLSVEEQQKQLEAVFSSLGDSMAKNILPGFEEFQKAGEGYMQTVIRVGGAVEGVSNKLKEFGITAVDAAFVQNKMGDLEAEIVRQSLMRREQQNVTWQAYGYDTGSQRFRLMDYTSQRLSAVGRIMETLSGSAADLISTYRTLVEVQGKLTALNLGDISTETIAAAGGLDNLKSGLDSLIDSLDPAQGAQIKVDMLRKQFEQLGQQMPKNSQGLLDLIYSIDDSTAAGQRLRGQLIALSGAMADVAKNDPYTLRQQSLLDAQTRVVDALTENVNRLYSTIKNSNDAIKSIDQVLGTYDSAGRISELRNLLGNPDGMTLDQQMQLAGELKDLVLEKYQKEKDGAQKLIDLSKKLNDYLQSLKTGDLSPLTTGQKLQQAQNDYYSTLAAAQGGDTAAQDKLTQTSDTYLKLARDYYASSSQYTQIFNSVSNGIAAFAASSNTAANTQLGQLQEVRAILVNLNQQAQDQLGPQTAALQTALIYQDRIARSLDAMSTTLPDQLAKLPPEIAAALRGTSAVNMGTYGAGQGGQTALASWTQATNSVITSNAYQTALATGNTGIASNMLWSVWRQFKYRPVEEMSLDERNAYYTIMGRQLRTAQVLPTGTYAGGLDYVPRDGFLASLHQGERIQTAQEAALYGRRGDGALIEELRLLREQVRALQAQVDQQTMAVVRSQYDAADRAATKVVDGQKEVADNAAWKERAKPEIH